MNLSQALHAPQPIGTARVTPDGRLHLGCLYRAWPSVPHTLSAHDGGEWLVLRPAGDGDELVVAVRPLGVRAWGSTGRYPYVWLGQFGALARRLLPLAERRGFEVERRLSSTGLWVRPR